MLVILYIKLEFDDVAVLHNISFALGAEEAGFFDGFLRAEASEVVVFADVGGDKASLKIGVDGAGGFGGSGTFVNSPGATLFFAGGQEGLEIQGVVGGFDEFAEGVVFDAVGFKEFFAFIARHTGHFFF